VAVVTARSVANGEEVVRQIEDLGGRAVCVQCDVSKEAQVAAMAYLDGGVIKDAFYVETHWFKRPTEYSPKQHAHECDETLGFFGGDPENPPEMGGEVELWIEDERHLLTKSSLVYIPAGVKHCPMHVRPKVRPIFHFSTGTSRKAYKREE